MKVFPVTEDPGRFKNLHSVFLEKKGTMTPYSVTSARFQKNMVLLTLEGIDSVEEAQKVVKCALYVDREHAIPLEPGEYYVPDLIGLSVVNEDGNPVGELTDVLETGANDVYVVTGDREILVPAVKEFILSIDMEARQMRVRLLEGM